VSAEGAEVFAEGAEGTAVDGDVDVDVYVDGRNERINGR